MPGWLEKSMVDAREATAGFLETDARALGLASEAAGD
jgi:hypothetical protein